MAINPNEDTEFNDALRTHGILPPRPPTPPSPSPPASPTLSEKVDDLSDSELRDLAEDVGNDETERMIETIRRQRLVEERRRAKARFGRVYPIGRDDYTREVTEASTVAQEGKPEGQGTGVVCFLYKDGIPRSDRTFEHIRVLAQRYPDTKFVSIVGDKCIPNLPDTRVPMIIIYRNGEVVNQIVSWGADRERRIEELEAVLLLAGAITPQEIPKRDRDRDRDSDDEDEESDDDASSRMRSAGTRTNRTTSKNIRQKEEDSDSDFDL
ncbi:thioredoxin-like protein [Daedalea quercina L-15889]|uniref:Thioredoxin-like protein n=1 Tax=Daedalea quercina L-15889 TaxID=1314783 RepID=A0A165TZ58_9APHY|nr:thioredoxin-like protein [Daedalea quercina L-15889]